jgi:hypothetical protein
MPGAGVGAGGARLESIASLKLSNFGPISHETHSRICKEVGAGSGGGSAFRSRHVICWNVPPDGLWATELS